MKNTIEQEMANLDMANVIKTLNIYAKKCMKEMKTKQLEGITPEDIVSETLLKVLEYKRNWETAKTTNFKNFLFMTVRSEISNLAKKLKRRNIGIFTYDTKDLHVDDEEAVTYAEPTSQPYDEEYVPNGYNNLDDEDAYHTE